MTSEVNPVQVQKSLRGVDYPASKDDLVARARDEDASDDVRRTLERLPDTTYNSPNAVSEAIGALDPTD